MIAAHVDTYILTLDEIASMREDYSFFGGASFVFGGLAFALSFELPLKWSYLLGKGTAFYFRYGGLFLALVGFVVLLAGIGTKKGDPPDDYPGEELGVIRERPRN